MPPRILQNFFPEVLIILNLILVFNNIINNFIIILIIGHYNRREGKSKFNKIYEFEHRLFDQNVKMAMTSVSGHLLTLDFTGSYRSWKACNPVALFDAPIIKFCPENSLNIKKTLEIEIKKSTFINFSCLVIS